MPICRICYDWINFYDWNKSGLYNGYNGNCPRDKFCKDCLKSYFENLINEKRIDSKIFCPGCMLYAYKDEFISYVIGKDINNIREDIINELNKNKPKCSKCSTLFL